MGEARDLMDQLTKVALEARDIEGAGRFFAADVIAVTPDLGQIQGRERLTNYMRQFLEAFPDVGYESVHAFESGNAAIDIGYYIGTHTGPLVLPSGESVPATGRTIKLRSCEVGIVEDGLIAQYEFYFDQLEMIGQLGLLPDGTGLSGKQNRPLSARLV